jgi:hypothetical protein
MTKKPEEEQEFEDLGIYPPDDQLGIEDNEPDPGEVEVIEEKPEEDEKPEENNPEETDYSKRVRKRIDREQRLKQQARTEAELAKEEANFWKAQAEEVARKLATATEASPSAIEEKQLRLQELREQLTPDETREEEERLILEIHGLKTRKTVDIPGVGKLPDDVKWREPEKAKPQEGPPPEAYRKWIESNPWYLKLEYKNKAAIAEEMDREMRGEGWDPRIDTGEAGEDSFFAELDMRIAKEVSKISGKKHTAMTGPAPKVEVPVRKIKFSPSQGDIDTMVKVGLDPSNRKHVEAYAKEFKRLEMRDERD